MSLSTVENEWLQGFFEVAEGSGNLSEWEGNFVEDQRKRYEEYGGDMNLSAKQWDILFRIGSNKAAYARPVGR